MVIPGKKTLRDLYLKEGMSMPEIGKKFRVHYITVRNWLIKYGIPTRKKGERVDSWSEKEVRILKENRGKPIEELLRLLPDRTNQAIYEKLNKIGYSRALEKFKYQAKKKLNLKKEEWGYLAGIVDGEGTITVDKCSRENSYHPKIAITTTNRNLAEWLDKKLNATCTLSGENHPFWKTKYECFIHGYKCKPILENILPFLKIKDRHARLLIEFIEIRLSRKSISAHNKKEEEIVMQLKRLNKKGKP
ncbi:hypothetical protein J7J12_02680 [bacterium]|nr:hypothetical protein [bacterium]